MLAAGIMASSTLESTRRIHEDIERAIHLSTEAIGWSHGLSAPRLEACGIPRPARARDTEYLARELVEFARSRSAQLKEMYEVGGTLDLETSALKDLEKGMNNESLSRFYSRLRELKDAHTLTGEAAMEAPDGKAADGALLDLLPKVPEFSGEEGCGKYLDLHQHYMRFINVVAQKQSSQSKNRTKDSSNQENARAMGSTEREFSGRKTASNGPKTSPDLPGTRLNAEQFDLQTVDYVGYVKDVMTNHELVPSSIRSSPAYRQYLSSLLGYLVSFADRLHPLSEVPVFVETKKAKVRKEILAKLSVLRDRYDSPQEMLDMMASGSIRDELLALGFKCGGTPLQRAERLFLASDYASSVSGDDTMGNGEAADKEQKYSDLGERSILEQLVSFVCSDMLAEVRRSTVTNVEKKLSLSWTELEAERIAEEAVIERDAKASAFDAEAEDLLEAEKPIYNPKDIPLGWDGRPIPYWLYKLHGLNHEYTCEICGGAVYKGPRAFERHFTDVQHVHGLRCLGVSYSKQYFMVTKIVDVVKLRDRIEHATNNISFDVDAEMEYEDSEGHVVNRKTYRDLERQGLL